MTTFSMTDGATFFSTRPVATRSVTPRAPRLSFAARLAALQARHERAEHVAGIGGVALRSVLALVPFIALTWVFVAV